MIDLDSLKKERADAYISARLDAHCRIDEIKVSKLLVALITKYLDDRGV